MKEIVYYILFFIVTSTIQQNDFEYGTCYNDQTDPGYVVCNQTRNGRQFPNNINPHITKLAIIPEDNIRWLITVPGSFTRFLKLKELRIVQILIHWNATNTTIEWKKEFFKIPTLSYLTIINCRSWIVMGTPLEKWTPPPNLEHLVMEECPFDHFDWRNVTSLKWVKLKNLKPPSLLEELYPSAGSLVEFQWMNARVHKLILYRVDEIALLCHMTKYSFNLDALQISKHYCECQQYLSWKKFLAEEENFILTYNDDNPGLVCSQNSDQLNCSTYTLEKAKENRAKCLNLYPIYTTTTTTTTTTTAITIPPPPTPPPTQTPTLPPTQTPTPLTLPPTQTPTLPTPPPSSPPATTNKSPADDEFSFWSWVKTLPTYIYVIAGFALLALMFASVIFLATFVRSPEPAPYVSDDVVEPADSDVGKEFTAEDETIESEE